MKKAWNIKRYGLLLWCFMVAVPIFADVIPTPRDPLTIEALISLHKLIKGEEDKALAKVATSFGEQSIITKGATKFNDVRTTLDSKLNNGYSYIILASALGSTVNSMYRNEGLDGREASPYHGVEDFHRKHERYHRRCQRLV